MWPVGCSEERKPGGDFTCTAVGERHGARQERQKQNEFSLPSEPHSHPGLQCSLFSLCSPADLEQSIAIKALKATGFQVGIVWFTLVCSHCHRIYSWKRWGTWKVLAAQCFPAGSAGYKGIIHLWLAGWLEKKLLQPALPGPVI